MNNDNRDKANGTKRILDRRKVLLGGTTLAATSTLAAGLPVRMAQSPAQAQPAPASGKPNILIIWGDDVGIANVSTYSGGLMGYETPNIDRIAREGLKMQHYYGEQSCTAGRSAFLTGQHIIRSGLSKVGFPGAPMGMSQLVPPSAACSRTSVMPPASSARTMSAIAMNRSPP
jgi:arylsulfatase